MADLCNKCALEMWGDQYWPDIDIPVIAESLEPGTYAPVLCEGCGIRAIGKNQQGGIMIATILEEGSVEDMVNWTPIQEWEDSWTSPI